MSRIVRVDISRTIDEEDGTHTTFTLVAELDPGDIPNDVLAVLNGLTDKLNDEMRRRSTGEHPPSRVTGTLLPYTGM